VRQQERRSDPNQRSHAQAVLPPAAGVDGDESEAKAGAETCLSFACCVRSGRRDSPQEQQGPRSSVANRKQERVIRDKRSAPDRASRSGMTSRRSGRYGPLLIHFYESLVVHVF